MKYFFQILFLSLLFVLQSTVSLASEGVDCRAVYSIQDNTLWVPCVAVVTPPEAVESYAVMMQSLSNTAPLQLSIQQILGGPVEEITDECQATYLVNEGTLSLPCVDVLETSDNTQSYQMVLKQSTTGNPSVFVIDSLELRWSAGVKKRQVRKAVTALPYSPLEFGKIYTIDTRYSFVPSSSSLSVVDLGVQSADLKTIEDYWIDLYWDWCSYEWCPSSLVATQRGKVDGIRQKYKFPVTKGFSYFFRFRNNGRFLMWTVKNGKDKNGKDQPPAKITSP
jgi:hypothetical protein